MQSILRDFVVNQSTIGNNAALGEAVDMRNYAGGFLSVPDSWSDANIGFKVCSTKDGTFTVAKDDAGAPIQISGVNTTTGARYYLPEKLFGAHFVKPWSKHKTAATETDVNQTGAKVLAFEFKG
jgi:hypothetical protein